MSNTENDRHGGGTLRGPDEVVLPENCDHESISELPDYTDVEGYRCDDCESYIPPEEAEA